MFYLIFWEEEKSISVVNESEIIKFETMNIVKVKWGKKSHEGRIVAMNGKFFVNNVLQYKLRLAGSPRIFDYSDKIFKSY